MTVRVVIDTNIWIRILLGGRVTLPMRSPLLTIALMHLSKSDRSMSRSIMGRRWGSIAQFRVTAKTGGKQSVAAAILGTLDSR